MIKYIKNLFKKLFDKKEVEIIESQPKPEHCTSHKRFRKSCPVCVEVIK